MRILLGNLSFRRSGDRSALREWRRALAPGAAALALLFLAVACSPKPDPQPGLDLNFASYGPLPLRVAHIDVVETYVPLSAPPHVEMQFTVPPDQAIRRWVSDQGLTPGIDWEVYGDWSDDEAKLMTQIYFLVGESDA